MQLVLQQNGPDLCLKSILFEIDINNHKTRSIPIGTIPSGSNHVDPKQNLPIIMTIIKHREKSKAKLYSLHKSQI